MRWRTKIFDLAAERGWSDSRLARELGVNQSTVWRQRSGTQAPSARLMFAAARVFQRNTADLWWTEQPEPPPVELREALA